MRRGFGIAALVLVILAGVAIGAGAYHAGVTHGLAEAASGGQVVRVIGPGYYGGGFFPFGIFLFPLFFFAALMLLKAAFWGRRMGGHDHPHKGPGWSGGGPGGRFEEMHRRLHEQTSGDHPGSGGEPSSV